MSSKSAESATTIAMNSGNLLAITWVKSMPPAVWPPTNTVVCVAAGNRRQDAVSESLTRLVVATSCGAERGKTWNTAVRPAGTQARRRRPRPHLRRDEAVAATVRTAVGSFELGSWTTILQRSVEALAKALRKQLISLVGGQVCRVTTGVALTEAHR